MLQQADVIGGHNIAGYDLIVLGKLHGFKPRGKVFDTLIASRLVYADMKHHDLRRLKKNANYLPGDQIGRHNLKSWGYRLGLRKGNFGESTDWKVWTPEMQGYCEQDVEVSTKLFQHIEAQNYSQESLDLEHDFAAIIIQQEQFGWRFDEEAAQALYQKLAKRREELTKELRRVFPSRWKEGKVPEWYEANAVSPFDTTPDAGWIRANTKTEAVNFCWGIAKPNGYKRKDIITRPGPLKKKEIPFNPGSRMQIAERLKECGWTPTKFTETGTPQIDETVLEEACEEIERPEVKLLGKYLTVQKRIGQIAEGDKAWMKLVKKGRIYGSVITNGAVTGRCTHNNPNVTQVPAVQKNKKKEVLMDEEGGWGWECRSCFIADPGYVLVGADASGLELRCLAHFLGFYDGGEYGRIVLDGDVHTANQQAAGLDTRDIAKTFIYAYAYGGGDEKLGKTAGVKTPEIEELKKAESKRWARAIKSLEKQKRKFTDRDVAFVVKGGVLRETFETKIPALGKLREAIDNKITEAGYAGYRRIKSDAWLRGLDGRILHIRGRHSSLNTLLQSAGALAMKKAAVILKRKFDEQGWSFGREYAFVANVHDEWQIQALPEIAEQVGRFAVEAIREAGEVFRFRCPLGGEFKIGKNWATTH